MQRMFSQLRSDSDVCQTTPQGFESPSKLDCSDQMKFQWHSWFQPVDSLQHIRGKKDETRFSPCTENENDVNELQNELNDTDCQVWSECLATIESIKTFINSRRHGYFNLMLSVSSWGKNYESNSSNDQYNQEEVIRRTRDLIHLTKKKELMRKDVIPCIFCWPYEAQTVYLSGSFLTHHFEKKLRMIRSSDRFVAVFELPKGTYRYKFLVDGQWRVLPNEPIHQSSDGSTSNILDISCNKQKSFNVLFEYEKARTKKYHNIPPDPCTYTSQAPNIPLLLRKSKTILFNGSRQNTTILHSLCNHMYLNVDSSRDFGEGIFCTSVTCRSRRTSKSILSSVGPREEKETRLHMVASDENSPTAVQQKHKDPHYIEHIISLLWRSQHHAEIAMNALNVDLQFEKEEEKSFIRVENCRLTITVLAYDWRTLRMKTNAFYESLGLIAEAIDQLDNFGSTGSLPIHFKSNNRLELFSQSVIQGKRN